MGMAGASRLDVSRFAQVLAEAVVGAMWQQGLGELGQGLGLPVSSKKSCSW